MGGPSAELSLQDHSTFYVVLAWTSKGFFDAACYAGSVLWIHKTTWFREAWGQRTLRPELMLSLREASERRLLPEVFAGNVDPMAALADFGEGAESLHCSWWCCRSRVSIGGSSGTQLLPSSIVAPSSIEADPPS